MAHGLARCVGGAALAAFVALVCPASVATAQVRAPATMFVAFATELAAPEALALNRSLVESSPLWSRCDYRGEGMLGGLALGIVLAATSDASTGTAAAQIGVGAAGGWLLGRFLIPPKRGCSSTAATERRGA